MSRPDGGTHPPVAELHLHLEGTLEPEVIFALAERNGVVLGDPDVDALRRRYRFSDLRSFLDLYYDNMAVLRTEEDFATMTGAYLEHAARAHVRHAEVFVDPQAHLARGVPLEVVMRGVGGALAGSETRHGLSTGLIACFLRDRGPDQAMALLEAILELAPPLLGVGLDSAEVGHPPAPFADVFARARAEGLVTVAHAGEEGPPSYIWEALDALRVTRIDHGIRCLEDDALVERLVAERIPLTVCPLSNVRLGAVPSIGDHPLGHMLDRGLAVTVNSDDPAYFGGYIDANYEQVATGLRLGPDRLATMARTSFEAAHLPPARRRALLAEVDGWEVLAAGG